MSRYGRKVNHETNIPLSAFDLATAYESNSIAHGSGPLIPALIEKGNLVEDFINNPDKE